jgi:hypothetical protein|tara:strand:+ start:203 stop:583 length:381 start_codon:yes stop_codon:yes gene_type:complete
MNIMQYFTKEGLAKYLGASEITKIIADPSFQGKLNDINVEVVYFSPDDELEAQKAEATKSKSLVGKKQADGICNASIIRDKLNKDGDVEFRTIARLGSKLTDFAKLDEYTPRIHKLQYTPPRPKQS